MLFTSTKKRSIAILLAGAVLFVAVEPARAIFGVADLVFDPSSLAELGHIWNEDISNGAKIVAETNQLIKIYSTGMAMYENAQFMRQRFSSGTRAGWMTAVQTGVDNYTHNQYGETVLWPQVMNGAPAMAPQAWANATVAMQAQATSNPAIGSADAASLALVEMIDGASIQCMQNLAQYRQNAIANQQPISFFRMKASDDTDSAGSRIEQAILSNFGIIHTNNELRAQGTIQSCEAVQQTLAAKQMRDEIVNNMNYSAKVQQDMNSQSWDATNPFAGEMP